MWCNRVHPFFNNLSVFLLKRQKRATLPIPTLSHQTTKNAKRDRKRFRASPAARIEPRLITSVAVPDAFPGHQKIPQLVRWKRGTHEKKTLFPPRKIVHLRSILDWYRDCFFSRKIKIDNTTRDYIFHVFTTFFFPRFRRPRGAFARRFWFEKTSIKKTR